MDTASHGNPHHPFGCQGLGTPMLVPSLQAQVGTYSGHFVCPADSIIYPPVLQDVTMKGLSAPYPRTLIFGTNNIFFLDTYLLTFPKEQMPDVSGMTVHGMPFHHTSWWAWTHQHLALPFPTSSYSCNKEPDLSQCPFFLENPNCWSQLPLKFLPQVYPRAQESH